jgi:hypothetical protein
MVAVAAVACSQLIPRLMFGYGRGFVNGHGLVVSENSWWLALLPPAWFAGFDDALAGSAISISGLYAAIAIVATAAVLWLAFGKLAKNYETGLQLIGEAVSKSKTRRRGRRLMDRLVSAPPLSWWLRDPVSRASFLLTTAYLVRDRDVKLRVYPGIAPMLVIPFVFLFQKGMGDGFGIAFSGGYMGIIPLLALNILKYSQQWQASDIFRLAPTLGPAAICNGARRAVLCFSLPVFIAIAAAIITIQGFNSKIFLLLPGLIAVPVYSLVPAFIGRAIPLSTPIEEGKSAGRGVTMLLIMVLSIALSGVAFTLWDYHWFWPFLVAETIVVAAVYVAMRYALSRIRWPSAE